MRLASLLGFAIVVILSVAGIGREPVGASAAPPLPVPASSTEVIFSPGCEAAIIAAIGQARTKIRVQIYTFTDSKIADALIAARNRGVDVAIIMDAQKSATTNAKIVTQLRNSYVTLRLDHKHPIAHAKFILIDGHTVLAGSFNFTAQAEKYNWEDLFIIESADIAEKMNASWNLHNAHAL